jgi:SAM-dependent methyltransferase
MLARARERGLRVVLGDASALPFAPASFDALVSTDGAFGLFDWPRALPECARVLREAGLLVLHLRTHAIWSPRRPLELTRDGSVPHERSGVALLEAARAAGFAPAAVRLWRWLRVFPYLVPVPPRAAWPLWNHGIFVFRRERSRRNWSSSIPPAASSTGTKGRRCDGYERGALVP